MIYQYMGISDDSKYISMNFESGKVYVSDVFADKYRLKKGDKFTLKESYGTKNTILKLVEYMNIL